MEKTHKINSFLDVTELPVLIIQMNEVYVVHMESYVEGEDMLICLVYTEISYLVLTSAVVTKLIRTTLSTLYSIFYQLNMTIIKFSNMMKVHHCRCDVCIIWDNLLSYSLTLKDE